MRILLPQAISLLQSGQVVAVPTETVYGLAASLTQPAAIEQIFVLKGRPRANPLIIHAACLEDMDEYIAHYPPGFDALAMAFWPGPLTCILPAHVSVPPLVRAGLPTAAFRIPSFELTRRLLRSTGPLVMPSANLSGRPSSTLPEHVEEDFGADFPVLDGGACSKGLESTILFYRETAWAMVRLGALTAEQFEPVLGYQPLFLQKDREARPLCPGQMLRHYAPRARLYLGELQDLRDAPFILGFEERLYPPEKRLIVLGSLGHPEGVAGNLYQALRRLDLEGADRVWVDMDFPRHGLWKVIAERLSRAGE